MGFCIFFSLLLQVHITFVADKVMYKHNCWPEVSVTYLILYKHDGLPTLCARLLGAVTL